MLFKRLFPFMDADTGNEGSFEEAANDGEVAELQTEEVEKVVEEVTEETKVEDEQKQEDVTQTQAFARRLREEKQKAIDAEYDRLYGNEYGIHSKSEYDAYIERQKLIDEGKDPEVYELKKKVELFERRDTLNQQDVMLSNDPKYGKLYTQWKDEVQALANQVGVDYNAAFTIIYRDKAPSLIAELEQKIETIEKNKQNANKSTGSLTGNGSVPNGFISKDTFEINKGNMDWVKNNYDALKQSMKKW